MKDQKYKMITKAEFSEKLGISTATRANWLNKKYFSELQKLGYRKTQRYLLPIQLKFLYNKLIYIPNENE